MHSVYAVFFDKKTELLFTTEIQVLDSNSDLIFLRQNCLLI